MYVGHLKNINFCTFVNQVKRNSRYIFLKNRFPKNPAYFKAVVNYEQKKL